MRAAGMAIALDLPSAVLGVLPGDSEEERQRALACALELCRPGLSIALHAAPVDGGGSARGPLFQLARWPEARRDRVAVSSAAAPAARPGDPRITWW